MSAIEQELRERTGSICELCGNSNNLQVHDLIPEANDTGTSILICLVCANQINSDKTLDANHWRCLNISMWSAVPAVQAMAWRMLNRLQEEGEAWPQDLLDTLYLDEETMALAKSSSDKEESNADEKIIHKDSNGTVPQGGDNVVLIKDLDVKGGGFTAKRGTVVRGISLVEGNADQIEGRINHQQIVILTQFVKKSS